MALQQVIVISVWMLYKNYSVLTNNDLDFIGYLFRLPFLQYCTTLRYLYVWRLIKNIIIIIIIIIIIAATLCSKLEASFWEVRVGVWGGRNGKNRKLNPESYSTSAHMTKAYLASFKRSPLLPQ